MPLWLWIALAAAGAIVVLAIVGWWLFRRMGAETKVTMQRVGRLPLRSKAQLAWRLFTDQRVPLFVRAAVPLLVLYLALPLDLIPDFIPVLGQLDDILIVTLAAALLIRSTPREVLEEHLLRLEASADRTSNEQRATSD